MQNRVKTFKTLIPYVAVAAGLIGLSSAWAAVLLYHAGALLFIALDRPPVWYRLQTGWKAKPAQLLAIMSILAPVSILLLWPLAARPGIELAGQLAAWGLSGASLVIFGIYFGLVHPVIEELFWRGDEPLGAPPLSWRDAAFAGYHALVLIHLMTWPWVLVAVATLVGASAIWRFAIRRGNFGAVVVAHSIADIGVLVAAFAIMGTP